MTQNISRILYIDPDVEATALFTSVAVGRGYAVDCADSGAAGLALLNVNTYDAVAMEVSQSDMCGLDLCRAVLEFDPLMPIVVTAKLVDEMRAVEAMEIGAARYVPKSGDHGFCPSLGVVIVKLLARGTASRRKMAADKLLKIRADVLQMIAEGSALQPVLELLCRGTERYHPGMRCSVLLYDANTGCLRNGAAPSLPDFYNEAIDGMMAGEGAGSCGTAAWSGERVIVEDVLTHPYWEAFMALAKEVGFHACWSQPVLDREHNVVGTFAMYYDEVRAPGQDDLELIETQANLASIAIQSMNDAREIVEKDRILENALDIANTGYWKWDVVNDKALMCSQGLAAMHGLSVDEYMEQVTTNLDVMERVHPDDRELFKYKVIDAGLKPYEAEFRMYDVNGNLRYLREVSRMSSEDGIIIGAVQDMTELKKIESTLRAAKEHAETANRAKSQFLAHMSHELRTPLNSILGFSDMIRIQAFGALNNPQYEEYIDLIHGSGSHLLALINDILDLSKVEAGEINLDEQPVNLVDCIEQGITMMSGQVTSDGERFHFEAPSGFPPMLGDERMLTQVVLNLLSNASKFTPDDGAITIALDMTADDGLELRVADTGCGIAEADIPKVLEPFGQSRDDAMHTHEGVGLGLSLTKSLVELHGGTLAIESTLGKGTTVTLYFPPERIIKEA